MYVFAVEWIWIPRIGMPVPGSTAEDVLAVLAWQGSPGAAELVPGELVSARGGRTGG